MPGHALCRVYTCPSPKMLCRNHLEAKVYTRGTWTLSSVGLGKGLGLRDEGLGFRVYTLNPKP